MLQQRCTISFGCVPLFFLRHSLMIFAVLFCHLIGPGQSLQSYQRDVRGAFVYKVHNVNDKGGMLFVSICHLTEHFNKQHLYPIVIFANEPVNERDQAHIRDLAGGATVEITDVSEAMSRFLRLDGLSQESESSFLANCNAANKQELNFTHMCRTSMKMESVGYLFMIVWEYMYKFQEPLLRDYDYFVSIDSDAIVTKTWQFDPFVLMSSRNLAFVYNQRITSTWELNSNSTKSLETIVGDVWPHRSSVSFDSEAGLSVVDDSGNWKMDSWGGWFSGGDLRLFRSPEYVRFAQKTYASAVSHLDRVDQQVIVTLGIGHVAQTLNKAIWFLPSHGFHTYMFHNWNLDERTNHLRGGRVVVDNEGMVPDEHVNWPTYSDNMKGASIDAEGFVYTSNDIAILSKCRTRKSAN